MAGKILFLVPYPLGTSPSQRFRFEQYFGILEKNGFSTTVESFLPKSAPLIVLGKGSIVQKTVVLLTGFLRRLCIIPKIPAFDFIFIHREASPIGPPIIEWIIAKVLKKKIIYDFDDAIWLTDRASEPKIISALKWRSKVQSVCKWASKVSCGNQFLRDFAATFNAHSIFLPTTIDTNYQHNPALFRKNFSQNIIIGWTGSHSTLKYLTEIQEVLQRIQVSFPHVELTIIADQKPDLGPMSFQFIPWSEKSEVRELASFDIGIMPLPDDEWSKGKCGFKALQYMAMEIPVVASAVGANTQIIKHYDDGLLVSSREEWYASLVYLINSDVGRRELGKNGRAKVIKDYSVDSNAARFLSLFT